MHLYERSRLVVEGAGAAGVAALVSGAVTPPEGARVVVVVSGGNVDAGAMEKIISAYLFESGRRAVFRIKVKDLPGQLARVVSIFERENINIAEIEQPPVLAKPISPEYTVFDICVETEGKSHIPRILRALEGERERMRLEGQEPFEIMRR
jgi:threonine dehydratase